MSQREMGTIDHASRVRESELWPGDGLHELMQPDLTATFYFVDYPLGESQHARGVAVRRAVGRNLSHDKIARMEEIPDDMDLAEGSLRCTLSAAWRVDPHRFVASAGRHRLIGISALLLIIAPAISATIMYSLPDPSVLVRIIATIAPLGVSAALIAWIYHLRRAKADARWNEYHKAVSSHELIHRSEIEDIIELANEISIMLSEARASSCEVGTQERWARRHISTAVRASISEARHGHAADGPDRADLRAERIDAMREAKAVSDELAELLPPSHRQAARERVLRAGRVQSGGDDGIATISGSCRHSG